MNRIATALLCSTLSSVCLAETAGLHGLIRKNGAQGVIISTEDFAVSKGSRICLISEGWKKVYLRNVPTPTRPPITVTQLPDGYVQTVAPNEVSCGAALDEYSVRCQGNQAKVLVKASAPRDGADVFMEHVAFVILPRLLEGAQYEITSDDGTVRCGVIPRQKRPWTERALLPPFRRGVFQGTMGTLTIEVTQGEQVRLDDRRSSSYFDDRGPSFIVWTSQIPVSATGSAVHELTLSFNYPEAKNTQSVSISGGAFSPVPRGTETVADFPLLPKPWKMQADGMPFRPDTGAKLLLVNGTERLKRHAERLSGAWGMPVELSQAATTAAGQIVLQVGDRPDDESYTLESAQDGIRIVAGGERAAFYALQTLRGLYRNGAFAGVSIEDKPAFKYRVVHSMADSDTKERLTPLITNVLAPLKINTILLECPYVKWESTLGMYRPESMEKSDLVELLQVAKEHYIQVWPLIPTFSHSEWFFWNDTHLEMIDNPRDRRAYNALHPGVRPFLSKLFDEVLTTFGHPEFFHISHDELPAEHPQRPEGKALGVRELFRRDLMWHYEFFRERNVKLMIWHDMLVARSETNGRPQANAMGGTETLRRELPKDIRVCVWNYDGPRNRTFKEVDVVAADGLPILGAGWFDDGNLEALTENCLRQQAEGMMITTWHDKVRSGGLLYTQYPQIHSYVRAAALFWNPELPELLNPPEILVDLLRKPERQLGQLQGIPFTANTVVEKEVADLSGLKADMVRTREGIEFKLIRNDERALCGLCVESRRLPHLQKKERIPLQGKFDRLHLLHTVFNSSIRQDKIAVKLVFRYTDDSYEAVYLRNDTDIGYGSVTVFTNDNGQKTYRPDEVATLVDQPSYQRNQYNCVSWQNAEGEPRNLWSYTWNNPHPEKTLDHLLVEAQNPITTYALLALTAETFDH